MEMSPQEKASSQTVSFSRDYGELKNSNFHYTLWMKRVDRNINGKGIVRWLVKEKAVSMIGEYLHMSGRGFNIVWVDCKSTQRPSFTRISNVAMKMCINNWLVCSNFCKVNITPMSCLKLLHPISIYEKMSYINRQLLAAFSCVVFLPCASFLIILVAGPLALFLCVAASVAMLSWIIVALAGGMVWATPDISCSSAASSAGAWLLRGGVNICIAVELSCSFGYKRLYISMLSGDCSAADVLGANQHTY